MNVNYECYILHYILVILGKSFILDILGKSFILGIYWENLSYWDILGKLFHTGYTGIHKDPLRK